MLRIPHTIAAVVAVALALETPTGGVFEPGKVLGGMARRDGGVCLPLNFTIPSIEVFDPAENNTANGFLLTFGFIDSLTKVQTTCSMNDTSKPGGPSNDTPRFACDNPRVQFIWQAGDLTLIEQTCPNAPE